MPSLLSLLTDPDAFLAAKESDWGYLRPGLLVAATGVIGAVNAYLWSHILMGVLPPNAQQFGTIAAVFGAIAAFVAAFFVWGIVAVVFFVFSVFFDGDGSLGKAFAFTGWGFLPRVFGGLVSVVVTYVGLEGVTAPSSPAQAATFTQSLQHQPIFLVGSLVGIAFLLWEGFIWTFAIKHARGLDLRDAAIVVYLPVGLYALYQLFTTLT